jgi:hypothetical protein
MTILPQLIENKGTVSSALGKELALKTLQGKTGILESFQNHSKPVIKSRAKKLLKRINQKP